MVAESHATAEESPLIEVAGNTLRAVLVARDRRVLVALRSLLGTDHRVEVVAETRDPGAARASIPAAHAAFVVAVLTDSADHEVLGLVSDLARRRIPVVALSFDPAARAAALEAGARRFLNKLDGPESLLAAVAALGGVDGVDIVRQERHTR